MVLSPFAQLSWAICHLWAEHRCSVKVPLKFWFLFWWHINISVIHPKPIFWFWKSLQYHSSLIIRGFTHIWSSASSSISHPQCRLEAPPSNNSVQFHWGTMLALWKLSMSLLLKLWHFRTADSFESFTMAADFLCQMWAKRPRVNFQTCKKKKRYKPQVLV